MAILTHFMPEGPTLMALWSTALPLIATIDFKKFRPSLGFWATIVSLQNNYWEILATHEPRSIFWISLVTACHHILNLQEI